MAGPRPHRLDRDRRQVLPKASRQQLQILATRTASLHVYASRLVGSQASDQCPRNAMAISFRMPSEFTQTLIKQEKYFN